MNEIIELIEDYRRKISSIKEITTNNAVDSERLKTKESCYKTFIVELERLKKEISIVKPINDIENNNEVIVFDKYGNATSGYYAQDIILSNRFEYDISNYVSFCYVSDLLQLKNF